MVKAIEVTDDYRQLRTITDDCIKKSGEKAGKNTIKINCGKFAIKNNCSHIIRIFAA